MYRHCHNLLGFHIENFHMHLVSIVIAYGRSDYPVLLRNQINVICTTINREKCMMMEGK